MHNHEEQPDPRVKQLPILKKTSLFIFICTAVLCITAWPAAGDDSDEHDLAEVDDSYEHALAEVDDSYEHALRESLDMGPAKLLNLSVLGTGPAEIDETLLTLYRDNGFQPFWIENGRPGRHGEDIREVLRDAGKHGLDPSHYLSMNIDEFWDSTGTVDLARLDILLSLGMTRYVANQREGRVEPRLLEPELFAAAGDVKVDWKTLFSSAVNSADMKEFLERQQPQFPQYRLLKEKLAEYQVIAAEGGWPVVPVDQVLKSGMNDPGIALLRQRLISTGDLDEENLEGAEFDSQLVEAVKHFQNRHNLAADGVVGKQTFAAMNVPVHERIQQLIINMERYRWLKHTDDERSVVVNIAGFELFAGRLGKIEISMPVIVGKTYHKTPIFNGTIRYVDFNPYWNVPPSIARAEILPKLQEDPLYLKKNNMRIFRGWETGAPELDSADFNWIEVSKQQMNRYFIRQEPGPDNALGTLKIMFPNQYDVYLHDTPSRNLFKQKQRALSHGCIRMARPAEMAAWVLGGADNGWSVERINEITAAGKRKVVSLKQPIPICILYRTVFMNPEDKLLHFYDDVYGRDKLLVQALADS